MITSFLQPDRLIPGERSPRILLHPTIPQPLHGVNPRSILGQVWWDAQRKAAYTRYDYHCWACGYHKDSNPIRKVLDAHESYSIDYRHGLMHLIEIVAVCYSCHAYIHSGRTNSRLEKGELKPRVYKMIQLHGDTILREAGLRRIRYQGPIAPWEQWRLVLDGVEYPPLYRSLKEWDAHFNKKG